MISLRLCSLLAGAVLALAACTPRANVMPKPAPADTGTDVEVLVGTTRARMPDGSFNLRARSNVTSYGQFTVSIPPLHEPGLVEIGGSAPDPERHFLTRSIRAMNAAAFRNEVARRLRANPQYNGEVFVFVHGFNTTTGDGVFRTAQIHSDLRLSAVPVHYSWPSGGRPLDYPYDRDSALFARNGLVDLIEQLTAAGARNIILVAHSLGTQVTMEALRQMSLSGKGAAWDRIGGVALLAPDIDVMVFEAQARDIGELPQPFLIFASQRDGVLQLSARLTGERSRLGNIRTIERLADLNVTVIDVSDVRDAPDAHLTPIASPTLIGLAKEQDSLDNAFRRDASARTGPLPGTILTVQNATRIVLDPQSTAAALGQ